MNTLLKSVNKLAARLQNKSVSECMWSRLPEDHPSYLDARQFTGIKKDTTEFFRRLAEVSGSLGRQLTMEPELIYNWAVKYRVDLPWLFTAHEDENAYIDDLVDALIHDRRLSEVKIKYLRFESNVSEE